MASSRNSTDMDSLNISKIIDNRHVSHISYDLSNQLSQEKVCRQCRQNESIASFCFDCKFALCTFCQNTHTEMKGFSNHVIFPISALLDKSVQEPSKSIPKMCPDHPKQPIKAHCKSCKIAICSDCKLEKHDLHRSESIEVALKRITPSIINQIRCIEKKRNQLNEKRSEVDCKTESIQSNYSQILKHIKDGRDRKIRQIEEDFRKLESQLAGHSAIDRGMAIKQNLDYNISCIDSVLERCNDLLTNSNDHEESEVLFELQNELKPELDTLASTNDGLVNTKDFLDNTSCEVMFVHTEVSEENVIGNILLNTSRSDAATAPVVKTNKNKKKRARKANVSQGVAWEKEDGSPQSSIIKYSRDFLLERRYVPPSVEKPPTLKQFPDGELVLDFPHQQGLDEPSDGLQYSENYIKGIGKRAQEGGNCLSQPFVQPLMDVDYTAAPIPQEPEQSAGGQFDIINIERTTARKQRKQHARSSSVGAAGRIPKQNQNVETRNNKSPAENITAGLLPTPVHQYPQHARPVYVHAPVEYRNANGGNIVHPFIHAPHSSGNHAIPNVGNIHFPIGYGQNPQSGDTLDEIRARLQRNRKH